MNLLLFSGSLRTGSLNKKLIQVVNTLAPKLAEGTAEVADIRELNIPVYDGDIEAKGIPAGVITLAEKISQADALLIASPEYNGSIAGSLKNTIDWVSRVKPNVLENKPVLLMGASPGYFGTIRALGHARAPFERLSAFVYPDTFALPKANEAFSPNGDLVDPATQKKLETLLQGFILFVKKLQT